MVKVGGSAEIPHDLAAETWIVVRVDVNGAGTYYPQGYAVPDPSGSWTCTITLGSPSRAEDGQYAVLAVLAAPKTSQAFQSYVKTQLATSVNGMSDYPADGVDVKDSVALTRDSAVLPTVVKQKEGTCK